MRWYMEQTSAREEEDLAAMIRASTTSNTTSQRTLTYLLFSLFPPPVTM
jgi:hypothetical protein